MSEKVIAKNVLEVLAKHLIDVEDRRTQLLERCFPDMTREREEFNVLIDSYINKVKEFINNTKALNDDKGSCPFIVIGSVVELENLDYDEIEKYRIVFPFESLTQSDMECASCLSPVGKALLLKKAQEKIIVENPMGQLTYVIKSIEIPDEMYSISG